MSNHIAQQPDTKGPQVPPAFGLVFGILVISTSSLFIRFAQRGAPSLAIAALRLSMASVILAPIALIFYRKEISQLTRRQVGLLLLSGFFLALHFATWISSLAFTSVASSVVLVTTSPLWVVILAPLVLKEKIPRAIWIGMLIALLGSGIVTLGQSCQMSAGGLDCSLWGDFIQGRAFWGNLLALAGAWFVAGYLLIGRKVRSQLTLTPYIFIVYSVAAFCLILIALVFNQPLSGYHPDVYFWCLMLAVFPQLMGHSTYNWALRYLPAAFVSISALGEPVASIALAFFFLQESPAPLEIAGGLLILLGIYQVSRLKTE